MTRRLPVFALVLVCAAAALAGATGPALAAGNACPVSNPPNELVLAGGSGQTAQLGKPFPAPLQVKLANKNGCPLTGNLAGVSVDFDAPGSGPSGIFAGSGSREAVIGTDAEGVATAPTFTANFTTGSYTVDAHSDYGTVELNLSNTASGLPAGIATTSGSGQAATVNSPYAQPLQARVTDANGNPVQGAMVSFSIVPGETGASASFPGGAQATATTDANGLASSLPFQANGAPGRFTAVASAEGLSIVASYSLDNHAATETLSADTTAPLSAAIDSRYPAPLAARLLDANGQPIEGASVTFTLGSSGGAAGQASAGAAFVGGSAQATALTDANGVATSPAFLANGTPGDFTATVTAVGAPALTYRLRNLAARLGTDRMTRIATVGRPFAHGLVAEATDSNGQPIDGASVTFTITKAESGATASFPDNAVQATVTTDAAGRAPAPELQANTLSGSYTVVVTMAGGTILRYALTNRAGAPATIAAGAASGEATTIGTRFPVPLAVTVTDRYGNPVVAGTVVFTAPKAGPSGLFVVARGKKGSRSRRMSRIARVKTNGNGVAFASAFKANRKPGGYVVTARMRSASGKAAFALVNEPQ